MRPDRPTLATPYLNTRGLKISRILSLQPYIQHLRFATKFTLWLPSEAIEENNTTTREWDTKARPSVQELASQSQSPCAQPSRFSSESTKPNFLIHVRDFQIHCTQEFERNAESLTHSQSFALEFYSENSLRWGHLQRRALLMCEGIASENLAATEGYLLGYMNWPNVEGERESERERAILG